jgi:hypothetical protein
MRRSELERLIRSMVEEAVNKSDLKRKIEKKEETIHNIEIKLDQAEQFGRDKIAEGFRKRRTEHVKELTAMQDELKKLNNE